jgi:hypothetical protein
MLLDDPALIEWFKQAWPGPLVRASGWLFPFGEAMHFIGRAITPPGRARRFDTSFLAMDTAMIVDQTADVVGPDSELVEVLRLPLSKALELDLPMITWVMLKELDHRLKAGMAHDLPVPFYREIRRKWVREEI